MSTANELLAAACASGISCLDEMNLLRVIAQGANAGGGGGGGGGGTLSTDGTFAANSDLLYPSQKAAKTYIDTSVATALTTADGLYVKKAGDTMTGALLMPAGAVGAPALSRSGDTNTGVWFPAAADEVSISTAGADRLHILSSGNVGIGIAAPLAKLHVSADVAAFSTTGAYGQIEITGATNSAKRLSLGFNTTANAGFVQSVINADNFYPLNLNPNGGKVGIGIYVPLATLHVTPAASGTDYFRIDHSDGSARLQVGALTGSLTFGALWFSGIVPSATNYGVASDGVTNFLNGPTTLRLGTGATGQWTINSSGHFLATTDNTYDIGASGATRPRALYVAGLATIGGAITGGSSIKSISASAGIGYDTGAGGTVTQITSRSTGVTLDKITGQITTTADSIAGLTIVTFVVTDSTIAATDTIVLSKVSGDVDTSCFVAAVAAGSFSVSLRNNHTVDADTTAFVLNFAVIKAVTS